MIAGAGREVAFDPPYHSNNQSISDPSRCAEHPFNEFYQRAGHQIRGITGKTEFSLQIHIYDWHKYQNKPNVMLSAGSGGSDKCSSLLVLLHLTEGGTLAQYSTRRFSILPQHFVYQQHPGFSLLSFPQAGFGATVSEFLGNSASVWILGNDATWQSQTSLNPTQGFLIRHPQAFQATLQTQFPSAPVSQALHSGWNLLANPYYITFQLKELLFIHSGTQKSFAQMVDEGLILPRIYLYGKDGFSLGGPPSYQR